MKSLNFIAFALIVVLLASCNKADNEATGAGDVILVSKKSGEDTVYGISIYAYTFSSFKSVTALNSSDQSQLYTLKANQGYKTNFYYETPDADYSTTKPAAATYNFSAVFENGATDEFQDILTDNSLEVTTFEKCEYNATSQKLEIKWDLNSSANSYVVIVLDGTNPVFTSHELTNTVNSISISGVGWASGYIPVNGKIYTVRLLAFLYEPNGSAYDVQATSFAETTFTWGN